MVFQPRKTAALMTALSVSMATLTWLGVGAVVRVRDRVSGQWSVVRASGQG